MRSMHEIHLADDALRLIADARRQSVRLQHEYIGTEHLVLALAHVDADGPVSPLADFGVDAASAYQLLEKTIRGGRDPLPPDLQRPFTSRTKQAFVYADEAARLHGESKVDVWHVLYGLMREGKSVGAMVLREHGLTAELVDDRIRIAGKPGGP